MYEWVSDRVIEELNAWVNGWIDGRMNEWMNDLINCYLPLDGAIWTSIHSKKKQFSRPEEVEGICNNNGLWLKQRGKRRMGYGGN